MEYRHDAAKGWLSTEITQWRRTFFNIAAKRTLKTLSLPFEVTSGGMQRNPWLPYENSHQKCSTWCSMRILACRIVHIEDVAIYGWESPGDSSLWTALVSLSLSCLWGLGFPFCLSEACWAWVLGLWRACAPYLLTSTKIPSHRKTAFSVEKLGFPWVRKKNSIEIFPVIGICF